MRKIGLIGTIGKGKKTSSGQEIRTKILYDAMNEYYTPERVVFVDTSLASGSKLRLLLDFAKCLLQCGDIILIVSRNGLRMFSGPLAFAQKFLHKRIYNNIIGGNIVEQIDEHPAYIKRMSAYTVNWVQMKKMISDLNALGLNNVELLPNSKPITIQPPIRVPETEPYRFCTFSRISKAKGTELAIEAVRSINREAGHTAVTLDIYGVPDEDYKDTFETVMKNAPDGVTYGGVIPYEKSADVLKPYFMLLFPTTFYGEGFPGTILDAYAAGLPVLASDWKFNGELVTDGVNGFIYEHDKPEQLKEKMLYAIAHASAVNDMRTACTAEASKYTPEKIMPIIFDKIDAPRG